MKGKVRSERVVEVTDRARAEVLLDPKTLKYLAPFVGEGRTADEAARNLGGLSLNTLLYQLRRLEEAGLLMVAGEGVRSGRRVKLYRAVGDVFFVPFDASPFTRPEELLLRDYEPLLREFLAGFLAAAMEVLRVGSVSEFGLTVRPLEDGRLTVRHGPHPLRRLPVNPLAPDVPAILNEWEDALKLDFEDAKALQRELAEVLTRYRAKSGSGTYVAHVGIAPRIPVEDDSP